MLTGEWHAAGSRTSGMGDAMLEMGAHAVYASPMRADPAMALGTPLKMIARQLQRLIDRDGHPFAFKLGLAGVGLHVLEYNKGANRLPPASSAANFKLTHYRRWPPCRPRARLEASCGRIAR